MSTEVRSNFRTIYILKWRKISFVINGFYYIFYPQRQRLTATILEMTPPLKAGQYVRSLRSSQYGYVNARILSFLLTACSNILTPWNIG